MTIKINLRNQNRKIKINLKKVNKAAGLSLRRLKKDNCELNINFVTSQKIRYFNRKYFRKDRATDVIAFPACDIGVRQRHRARRTGQEKGTVHDSRLTNYESRITNHESRITNYEFLGDIAVSTDRARHNAKVYKMPVLEEVVLYVVHGILHLLGYEDTSEKKRRVMKKKENEIFQIVKKFV